MSVIIHKKLFFKIFYIFLYFLLFVKYNLYAEWLPYTNNPIIPDNVDKKELIKNSRSPAIIYENNTFKMWFMNDKNNNNFCLDYLISSDGLN